MWIAAEKLFMINNTLEILNIIPNKPSMLNIFPPQKKQKRIHWLPLN